MGKCWAFYPIAGTRSAWIPCVREAEEGRRYCRRHWDALAGIMLGSIVRADEARKMALAERRVRAQRGAVSSAAKAKAGNKNEFQDCRLESEEAQIARLHSCVRVNPSRLRASSRRPLQKPENI